MNRCWVHWGRGGGVWPRPARAPCAGQPCTAGRQQGGEQGEEQGRWQGENGRGQGEKGKGQGEKGKGQGEKGRGQGEEGRVQGEEGREGNWGKVRSMRGHRWGRENAAFAHETVGAADCPSW